jgi:hypothetical protein
VCAWKIGSAEPLEIEGAHQSEVTHIVVAGGFVYSTGNDDVFFKTPVGEAKYVAPGPPTVCKQRRGCEHFVRPCVHHASNPVFNHRSL